MALFDDPAWEIRPVLRADLNPIAEFEAATFGADAMQLEGLLYCWKQGIYFRKIALKRNPAQIAGFIIINAYREEEIHYELAESIDNPEEKIAHILNFCMHPDWRRKGLGGPFFDHVCDQLLRQGYEYVLLEEQDSNVGARQFYEKKGFRVIQKVPRYYLSGQSAWIFLKTLNAGI